MDDINTSEYFKLDDKQRLQYDRFVYTLCHDHLIELSKHLGMEDAKDIFIKSLRYQKEESEFLEEYEVCQIISKAIKYIKNYQPDATT